ncbi:MAG: sodium:proton antiporter [Halothiobacillaceae bacterium]|nr:MAG: sodium:proton antiporter [Halothiobacillaceae bacterium]
MHQELLVALTAVIFLGIAAQWVSWKIKVPAILFLLVIGVVAGPVTGLLDPDAMFGELLFPMVSLAVAVILFEGSLTLRFKDLSGLSSMIQRLVTVGMLASWGVATLAAHWFVGFGWQLAALFGALVVVTGPTVIIPLLRSVRPKASVATVLRWEGIVIDPIGALLAVLVYEFILTSAMTGEGQWGAIGLVFLEVIGVGAVLGAAGGHLLGVMLRRHWLPDFLINVVVLAFVLTVFTTSNLLAHESGLLAVTVMGIWMANMKNVPLGDVLHFKETLTILFISGLFILLAARIDFATLAQVGFGSLLVFLAIQFVAQPLKVWLSGIGTGMSWQEKLMIAWIGPRGIVAAAISGLFALKLQDVGFVGAESVVPLTFIVIIGTVVFASATARLMATRLGMAEPEARGVLIVGSNDFSRGVAKALKAQGFRAIIADSDYTGIRQARMEGLDTYFGNVVSEEADRKLDLVGVGRLFAMSLHPELNTLATMRYKAEFGAAYVHVVLTPRETMGSDKQRIARHIQGQVMFGEDIHIGDLRALMDQGGEIYSTRLTETFGWEAYKERHADCGHLLFAISPKGVLHVTGPAFAAKPSADWVLIGLYKARLAEPASLPGPVAEEA